MESIVINPKTIDEVKFITTLLEKMNISSKVITDEEKEDIGLVMMMKEVDRSDKVTREEVMRKLNSWNDHWIYQALLKDLDKISKASIKKDISTIIEQVENAVSLSEINNIKKLKGYLFAYRIRSGDYRIGLVIENNVVEFARVAHRKDIYKVFP